ncbi:MAG: molybdenum cofactor guanylyltransferase [Myxococcales bacterium]|nr:molybdenum cofactor guanylyltransferase [Myxococcales bacterium]
MTVRLPASQRPEGFVLAGGRSTRMGFDKARADLGGRPLALVTLLAMAPVAGRLVLIRRGPPVHAWHWDDGRPVEVLREADDGAPHPLWGVATALGAARSAVALVCPCDVPRISAQTWQRLAERAPAVAEGSERRHPLVGAFPVSWAARALTLAAAGGSVHAFARDAVGVPVIDQELVNVNDPATLEAVAGLPSDPGEPDP